MYPKVCKAPKGAKAIPIYLIYLIARAVAGSRLPKNTVDGNAASPD